MTKITLISDLHGFFPTLDGGDLLIIAGDLTARDEQDNYDKFIEWLNALPYRCKVVIAGNHDGLIEKEMVTIGNESNTHYLCDSGMEFEGFRLWGSPYTRRFHGQNRACMAFSVLSEFQLNDHFNLIPDNTDILITHTPPLGILDQCANGRVGSPTLRETALRIKPRLCCFGHIHEEGGKSITMDNTTFVNASVVNEYYKHVNKPVHLEL